MLVLKQNQMWLRTILNDAASNYPLHVVNFAKKSKGFMTLIEWNETEAWEVEQSTHEEKPEKKYDVEEKCVLGKYIATFTVWEIEGKTQLQLETVRAKSDETGCYEDIHGEELNRWKAQVDTQANQDFVLKRFSE